MYDIFGVLRNSQHPKNILINPYIRNFSVYYIIIKNDIPMENKLIIAERVLAKVSMLDVKASVKWSPTSDQDVDLGNQLIEDYNNSLEDYRNENFDAFNKYYIIDVTGRNKEYFTLWNYNKLAMYNPYSYIKNLAKNYLDAVQKVLREYANGHCYIMVGDVEVLKWDPQVIKFGKHRGENIYKVFKTDPQYITWFVNQYLDRDTNPEDIEINRNGFNYQLKIMKILADSYYDETRVFNEENIVSEIYTTEIIKNIKVTIDYITSEDVQFSYYSGGTKVTVKGHTDDNHYIDLSTTGKARLELLRLKKGDSFIIEKAKVVGNYNRLGINYNKLSNVKIYEEL